MPVARSYQSLEQIGEPYISNGKQYINLRFKNGNVKPARWYSDSEYKKLYGEPAVSSSTDPYYKPQKDVLGFSQGFVWIFEPSVGMNTEDKWLMQSSARYHRLYGWYFISDEPLPSDLPFGYNPIKMPWEVVGLPNGELKSETKVETAIKEFLNPNPDIVSVNYPHSIGERIELEVKLEKIIPLENNYGVATMFRMIGITDILPYIWITSAKRDWQVGNAFKIRGTIKDLKNYKGEFQINLNRVNEVVK